MTQTIDQSNADLEQFVQRSYAELIRFVRSRVPEQDAHDVVQDTLAVLVKKRGEVETSFRAFTFGVVRNQIHQYYASKKRGGILAFLDDMDEFVPMAVMSTRLSIRVARTNDLEAAMQGLTRRQFEVFELRYIHNLTLDETGEALEISPATVKREVDRARAHLVCVLGDVDGDDVIREVVRSYVQVPLGVGPAGSDN